MYDMDKCVDYVPLDIEGDDDVVAAIRLDGRIWLLMHESYGPWKDWIETDGWSDRFMAMLNNLIDRHYLEKEHGELYGSASMQNGAL